MSGFISGHFNYHVPGINSYLIRESKGESRLLRVFHAVGNEVSNLFDKGDYAIAPHNHSFDIRLMPLFGNPYNVDCVSRPTFPLDTYEYPLSRNESGFGFGSPVLRRGVLHLYNPLSPNGTFISSESIHTMMASRDSAWLTVQVSEDKGSNHNLVLLSMKSDFKLDTSNLYTPMNQEELRAKQDVYDKALDVIITLAKEGVIEWQA